MVIERLDLDGLRLFEPGEPDVWLMFHGRRHRIASPAVYDGLFSEVEGLVTSFDINAIAVGEELVDGSCLIRADGTLSIYLLTVIEDEVRRCFIPTYEAFLEFGFDESRVRNVPPLLLRTVPVGRELTSAGARASR